MLLRILGVLIIGVLAAPRSLAQSEEARREGFYQQQKANKEFDQEREAGLRDYLKEQADWHEQRKKDIQADKKRKTLESPVEGGPEYKADRKEKKADLEAYELQRKAYIKEKKSSEAKNAKEQKKRDAWALEEYGLDKERPRFDIAKRKFFGGKSMGTAGRPGSSGGSASGGGPSFPPPPSFEDFNDGYVPPPFPPPEAFDSPAESFSPPPPYMGEGGGDFDGGYFPPPPPPPPPIPAPMDGGENF
jgi:hypothetical protein